MSTLYLPVVIVLLLCTEDCVRAPETQPAGAGLLTQWAREVTPANVHREYPRPQMVRPNWVNLNGHWDYAVRHKDAGRPDTWDGKILVPFPLESTLGGVGRVIRPGQRLWYRRTFDAPELAAGRLLLHFGGVDWHTNVWINGEQVGAHQGGYDAFTFDMTDALRPGAEQEILLSVWDPTDQGFQPRGKQVLKPGGIFYTAVTGIWQTVWLEPVPEVHIARLKMTPDVDRGELVLKVAAAGPDDCVVKAVARDGKKNVAEATGPPDAELRLMIDKPKLWSPDSPHLYDLEVTLARGGRTVDCVTSYFGMRKIEVRECEGGLNRLLLNNEPLFHFGPLDQGWWPGGLYTAPTDAALKYDVEITRKLGFNMCRKHVKVEPARWYYWCDRLGLMVWQDMPSGDRYIGPPDPDLERTSESEQTYRHELRAMIDGLGNHPSVVVWVPFNEGWGQFKTDDIMAWIKLYDPSRLVDGPSGWADRGSGDLHDMHSYPGPGMFPVEQERASVLGEFGGLGLRVEGHLWRVGEGWGYRSYESREQLWESYSQLIERLGPLIARGLAAAVYTQTTDVESECNGLMTYDRAVIKLDANRAASLNGKVYLPPPIYRQIVPTSEMTGQSWRYTTDEPAENWFMPYFDDSSWREGVGGFGREGTPGTVVRTRWHTDDMYLRRTFTLERVDRANLHLCLHHDEDVEVYLNGVCVLKRPGYVTSYIDVPLDAAGLAALREGSNTLAIHCHQTEGGQYADVGIVSIEERR